LDTGLGAFEPAAFKAIFEGMICVDCSYVKAGIEKLCGNRLPNFSETHYADLGHNLPSRALLTTAKVWVSKPRFLL
jgi:hypothetical protein